MAENFKPVIDLLSEFIKDRLETMKNMDMSYKGGRELLQETINLIKKIGEAMEILRKR